MYTVLRTNKTDTNVFPETDKECPLAVASYEQIVNFGRGQGDHLPTVPTQKPNAENSQVFKLSSIAGGHFSVSSACIDTASSSAAVKL
jgi:hypothetical protein